jgi:gluconolactonase
MGETMFPPPAVIETEVFSRVPESLQIKDRQTAWAEARQRKCPTSFLEGPAFDRAGNFYCTDIPYGRIFRVAQDGTFSVFMEYDGEPNGLRIHKDGRLFVADRKRGLISIDPESHKITPVMERAFSEGFKGLNDLVFARNGDIYFTDQGQTGMHDPSGRVFRLRADGRLDLLLDNVPSPNGVVLNLAEDALYVSATRGNTIWRAPLLRSGGVTRVAIFIHLSGGLGGPDGLAMDQDENLAVCHAGLGTVWLFSRLGEPLYRIKSCAGIRTTNMAYGGPDGKSLFITESETGTILKARLPVAGKPMYSHC